MMMCPIEWNLLSWSEQQWFLTTSMGIGVFIGIIGKIIFDRVEKKRNDTEVSDVYNSGDKALGGTKTVSNDTIDEKNNSLTAHPKPR